MAAGARESQRRPNVQTGGVADERRVWFVGQRLIQRGKCSDAVLLAQALVGVNGQRIAQHMGQTTRPRRQELDRVTQYRPEIANVTLADGAEPHDEHSHIYRSLMRLPS